MTRFALGQVRPPVAVIAVIALSAISMLAVQASTYPGDDVSYLTWVADKVWHSAVYGRDIREINPPLAALIYSPAAMFGQSMGFALKLWIVAIACLSLATLSCAMPSELRLPVVAALGLFAAFAFPREFGQREQIALLLCAPYAAGPIEKRNWAVLSGVMAGLGFALKPYFLIGLLLVFLGRRRVGTEEKMIVAVGLAYAASLVLLFQYYLRHLSHILRIYSEIGPETHLNMRLLYFVFQAVPALALGWLNRDTRGLGFALASAGFAISATVQGKFFSYHFMPAWGFLMLYLVVQSAYPRWRWIGSLLLLATAVQLAVSWRPWLRGKDRRDAEVAALVQRIDASDGFIALSTNAYPAFPAAIYSSRPYRGTSAGMGGLAVIGKLEKAGRPVPPLVTEVTLDQVLTELDRRPGLVIVQTDWSVFDDLSGFDGLQWLNGNAEFRRRWSKYAPAGQVGEYRLFRRIN